MKKGDPVDGGKFYEVDARGHVAEIRDPGRPPEAWICRRVLDYPIGFTLPAEAGFATCALCGADIVFNTGRTFAAKVPKVCMQCAHITPDPL